VSESGFSEELERFLAEEIQSLEQLEILLLLSADVHKWWTARGVYDVVKSSPNSVEDRLKEFSKRGMLKTESGIETRYQFALSDPSFLGIINELREAYKARSVKVVQAIYSKPPDPMSEFAKAFRIRKEEG
jgi:hypothetical protein